LAPRAFRARKLIHATPEAAFDFVADHRHVVEVLDGVTRWRPLGRRAAGAGARFEVEMSVLGLGLGGILRIDSWERPRRIRWVSESGPIKQHGGWRLTPRQGGVELELEIAYEQPGGVAADLLAGGLERLVSARLEAALERIRERLEG
jgi:ribosome-associated toxin RatA of RatAB toxin-antitoxin module